MIIEFYDHMFFFFHLVQIYFGPLNCHYYVNTLIQCAMNVYFSHVNSKKKKSLQQNTDFISYFGRRWEVRKVINSWCALSTVQFTLKIWIFWIDFFRSELNHASYQQLVCTVNCAVHSRNLKNFAQSKFLCISLLLKHAFSRQEFNKIRVDAGQICGIRDKL